MGADVDLSIGRVELQCVVAHDYCWEVRVGWKRRMWGRANSEESWGVLVSRTLRTEGDGDRPFIHGTSRDSQVSLYQSGLGRDASDGTLVRQETEMRLLVEEVANRFGLTVREQHPVHQSGRLITVFDLALIEPRVGIMYDGRHHWDYQQRQKDALINLDVTAEGWTPLRFSSGTLPELPARLERLLSDKYRAGGKPTWGK